MSDTPTISKPPPMLRKPITMPVLKPPTSSSRAGQPHTPKSFSVKPWTGAGEGKKVLMYGPSGMGKTTLATMAPNAIFIGLDDGGRETRHPKTGLPVNAIPGIETWNDLRDALHQPDLFPAGSSLVVDTITKCESLAEPFLFATVKTDGGQTADSIEAYGWGKGYRHLLDVMRLLLTDMDTLVRRGVNIILLAQQGQATVANLEGTDYAQDGPLLTSQPKNGANVRAEICAWADNIFRIGYPEVSVVKANKQATKGRATGSTERNIFTEPEVYYVAKNRMNGTLAPVVSFAKRDDDSIWQFLFGASA